MRPAPTLVLVLLFAAAVPVGRPAAAPAEVVRSGDAYGRVAGDHVVLGNDAVERRWRRGALATTRLRDKRTHAAFEGEHADFGLVLGGVRVASDAVPIAGVGLEEVAGGGVRARFTIDAGVARIVREVEVYPGIAGFQSRTRIEPLAPLVLSGYSLDEVAVGEATPTITAFRAGADWREPDWAPQLAVGDPHTGDWRETRTAARGQALEAPGEWLSLERQGGERVFTVMERRDYASSRMAYDGMVGSAVVDLSRDVIYLGPFEENAHAENPGSGPARARVLVPGRPLTLETAFTGLGRDADDEPWQWYRYLTEHRLAPYPKAVVFNTDQVDDDQRSTAAKDDVDFARFTSLLAAAREMGVETFVFDDGWQARSGDWCPDSEVMRPECHDARWDGTPTSKFRPRFPDDTFAAVRAALAGGPGPEDDLAFGLWMNPMEFHPRALAFQRNPQWACAPVGHATAAVNVVDADGDAVSSSEAGIGVWNPEALGADPDTLAPETLIGYIEGRIRRAIDVYGARYFKFDFLVWVDCAGVEPVDLYAYHDSFVSMVDRVQADHPEVTFQIDDTNDYRMFPFETVARGPSWFANGSPDAGEQLHNLWSLAPYVPPFVVGQRALNGVLPDVDHGMAVTLPSHLTFSKDIDTELSATQRSRIKKWTDFYKAHRDTLATFTYPLLADPSGGGWTALQPWNPDAGRGWLLAYRQGAPNATQAVPLRGVPDGTYELTAFDPAISVLGVPMGQATAAQLRAGRGVTIAGTSGYAIIEIEKVA